MTSWFWYAVAAAALYGAHQIFTKVAADRIGEGLGGFVVEATAALSIFLYLVFLRLSGSWNQKFSASGFNYSLLTGICVGAGTIAFYCKTTGPNTCSVAESLRAAANRKESNAHA
jgi:transporter family protein